MEALHDASPAVGGLIMSNDCVHPAKAARHVVDRFFESRNLDALALVEGMEPVGLVTRTKLLFSIFRRYGLDLYGRRPVIALADTEPLSVHEGERLDVVLDMALGRPSQDIYDEIIITGDDGSYKGLVSVRQMIIQQSNLLANNIVQREIAQERAKELERINNVKSQFIANVTHELRSPVNAIIGLGELMKMACEKGHVDQLRDRLTLLMSNAANLRAVITNILDLSKLEAGKMEVVPGEFDPAGLLREAAETTKVLLGSKPVQVEVLVDDNLPVVYTDPVKVRQIVTNLMSNAAKFTDRGRIVLSAYSRGEDLVITVADTGIGIRDGHMEQLFDAFHQLEDAKAKRHEGTGLGLTITRNLVRLLGGSITLNSVFGKGTTFQVSLPLAASPIPDREKEDYS